MTRARGQPSKVSVLRTHPYLAEFTIPSGGIGDALPEIYRVAEP